MVLHVGRDRAAQLDQTEVRRVVGLALLKRVDGRLADVPGRVEIRLAYPERDDVLHLRDDLEEVADARLGQARKHGVAMKRFTATPSACPRAGGGIDQEGTLLVGSQHEVRACG